MLLTANMWLLGTRTDSYGNLIISFPQLLKEVCIMGEDENVIVQNMSLSGDLSDRFVQ